MTGRQKDLEAAVRELDGHALSVTLLGTFLAEVCDGDVKQRDRFKFGDIMLTPEEQESADATLLPAKRAAKVMAGYLDRFDELAKGSEGLGGPEQVLLHLLGLFDRPADGPAVDMLLSEPIAGLTDALFVESAKDRLREAKSRLRKLRLLAKEDPKDRHGLDAHPVVRAYFATRLEETAPEAARAAHERLYRHYAAASPALPDTLEEMRPLFHAIGHGVKAGRVEEAYDEVYKLRIMRTDEAYILLQLGAFSADLAATTHFFQNAWSKPHPSLSDADQAWLLNSAAFALTALGRLRDAITPRRAGIAVFKARQDWVRAARGGGNLSQTLLELGALPDAVDTAEKAVVDADTSGEIAERAYRLTNLATVLAHTGDLDRAAVLLAEADKIQTSPRPLRPPQYVYYKQVYAYGDLLLGLGKSHTALDRGQHCLALAKDQDYPLLDVCHCWLLIGRAQDALGESDAAVSLDKAVEGIRKSGQEQYVPQALLARAAHRRKCVAAGETALLGGLRDDLAEVEDIAEPEMRLYLTDLALERARLALDVPASVRGPEDEAAHQTQIAANLIAATGYHRRDGELRDLQARLAEKPRG